jgi:RNA polymerase sigma-70 factor (ECF subfamily)
LLRYAGFVSAPIEGSAVQVMWEASSRRLHAWFERRTGNAHDADDLVQETFLRVQSKLDSLRDDERLGAWIGTVARNVLADHGRARGRPDAGAGDVEAGDALSEEAQAEASGGDGARLTAAVAGWIEAFLARLEPEDAAILRAVELEGRAQVDVARELGLSASGARSRVQRARARLRRALEACCRFAFDRRGNLTDVVRRPGNACDCDGP